MAGQQKLDEIAGHLGALGARKLSVLAMVGVFVFGVISLGSYYISQSEYETLYAGLEIGDVSRIGAALGEAGISFDVDAEGKKVLVPVGYAARARMLLAEKGLPGSASAGYELFDKLGSMGLTSFMQNVTRVRALEGEIGRTILSMNGVKAVRVHIVMPDKGSFRRVRRPPSASVMIRTNGVGQFTSAAAIRHLVAAAVPGMKVDHVNVLGTDGRMLATGGDSMTGASGKLLDLEKLLAKELRENVSKTLIPYLGYDNFQVSVLAKLNLDQKKSNEVKFDPDSKVERSVRTIKETGNSQNTRSNSAVGVEQNIPAEENAAASGDKSLQEKVRREELRNFELNSRTTSTVSQGYRIETIAIAVVVNRKAFAAAIGGNASAADIDRQLETVKRLVSTAAGINLERGDKIAVSALDFIEAGALATSGAPLGLIEKLTEHTGAFIKALTVVVVAFLLIWFGLRPVTRMLLEQPGSTETIEGGGLNASAQVGVASTDEPNQRALAIEEPTGNTNMIAGQSGSEPSAQLARLEQMVEIDAEQAAATFKQWMREEQPQ